MHSDLTDYLFGLEMHFTGSLVLTPSLELINVQPTVSSVTPIGLRARTICCRRQGRRVSRRDSSYFVAQSPAWQDPGLPPGSQRQEERVAIQTLGARPAYLRFGKLLPAAHLSQRKGDVNGQVSERLGENRAA